MQSIVEAAKIHREATKHDGLSTGQETCRGRRQGVEEDRNRDRDRNVSGPAYYDFYRSVTVYEKPDKTKDTLLFTGACLFNNSQTLSEKLKRRKHFQSHFMRTVLPKARQRHYKKR